MGKKYYLGLDIGTDSVGYAVTDEQYNLLKFHGKEAWGSHVFDGASLSDERRSFRTARRRLDRRQQRVSIIQELFAAEIAKKDPKFFRRLQESYKFREECGDDFILFNDPDYTDTDYYTEYPTIHHLLVALMNGEEIKDIRLVYIACAWLVAHRGHFLSNISMENIQEVKDFDSVYSKFTAFFRQNGYKMPWNEINTMAFGDALKKKCGVNNKNKELVSILNNGQKPGKISSDGVVDEEFPFSLEGIIKLLAGGTYSLKDLFGKEEYDNLEIKSVSLGMDDEKLAGIMADIGDDYDLIDALRSLYDWAVLADTLGDDTTISAAKVKVYEQHKADLPFLKHMAKKYVPERYDEIFREVGKDNYASYAYHTDEKNGADLKKVNAEAFSKFVLGIFKNVEPTKEDKEGYDDMISRLELRTFMPKQKNTDNRVIPHQLYWYELHCILKNAARNFDFLNERDDSGLTVSEKIEKTFLFRIPYFVGPLNKASEFAWLERKAGKIYPWNFEDMVDLDKSEENFIKRMTNTCTYIPGEPVLPKDSLAYHRFMVLNELNNVRINGIKLSVELKQRIYNEVFMTKKKVTRKYLASWLRQNNIIDDSLLHAQGGLKPEELIGGIDEDFKSNLVPQIAFRRLMESGMLQESDVERIIERASYAEDKQRLSKWLSKTYPSLSDDDRKYICSIKIKDFGRLSRKLLCEIEGAEIAEGTGELFTVLGAMWNSQNNFMEVIADPDKYTFSKEIESYRKDYYSENKHSLDDRMEEMYLSNAVKRSVFRTLDIVRDIRKAFGVPEKIFVEMTRGGTEEQKGKRTLSRKQQILDLYAKCKDEDVRVLKQQLEELGEAADSKLQGEKLFLYYMQLGKSIYSGKPIELSKLGDSKLYDVDHIYPQAYVKDDSIINNKVLCLSEENGKKSDIYPIAEDIRHKMEGYWHFLKDAGLISDEKYKRLTRRTPFTDDEKIGFINRQITETSQSTKAVASLLKEYYPDTEIVYSKARMTSDFRKEFDLLKSRVFNDLHHAVDAYLNIVTGNVYNSKFTKNFRLDRSYSIKIRTVFTNPVMLGEKVVWDPSTMLEKVKKTASKDTAHFTKFAFFKKGGLFDQMPVHASEGLVPIKKGRDTAKYGGYNKAGAMFFIPVRYKAGKKSELFIMSVELLCGEKFLQDEAFAKEYSFKRLEHILGKKVDDVTFPLGMRPWKVNTMLSLDGFRVCIAGGAGGGRNLIAQPCMQFIEKPEVKYYIKKLEEFDKKNRNNPNYVYDCDYDKVSNEKNMQLYDLYISKYKNSIYKNRINAPIDILEKGISTFKTLDIKKQAAALLGIHETFGRVAGGCDLSLIGGGKNAAATVNFSATVSNWKKKYSDVRIIDASVTGVWEKKSDNLLDLL